MHEAQDTRHMAGRDEEAIASERKRHRQSPNHRPTGHDRSFSQVAWCSWHDAQGAQQTVFGVRREEGAVRGAGAGAGAVAVLIELTVKSMVVFFVFYSG